MTRDLSRLALAFTGLIVACSMAVLGAGHAYASAWTQPKGHGIVIIQDDRWSANDGFASNHNQFRFPNNGQSYVNETNVYVEYGLTRKLTLLGNFWLDQVGYKNDYSRQENFGFADQEVGARYKMRPLGFLGKPWVGSSQILVGFPTYKLHDVAQPLGTGGASVEVRHAIGRPYKLFGMWSYIDMSGGLRMTTGRGSHELRFDATNGTNIGAGFTVMVEFSHIQTMNNAAIYNYGNPISSTNFDLTKMRFSLLKKLGPVSLQAGYERDLAGRNTGDGQGPFVGIWIPFGGSSGHWEP
ncbi:hypothetical protein [Komagataeibacter europaeus]|uniref:hypothetical protein n=1 Tax=Komagataeibacter europaeus TaxID=33995 RepID=UPI000B55BA6B|nr:hypothetical protein [Komagataeibacter europaeus]ARW15311.1 hypothetical protein S101446_00170 [Komagataeibacter europaeus]